ncbi:MAG: hypothetical protein ACREPE_10230 [Lysobacter sp.]
MRSLRIFLFAVLFGLAGCASVGTERNKLDEAQFAWSGAIRWGDFDGATNLMDPKLRDKTAPTEMELERYKQVQISAYRDLGASADLKGGTAVRDIQIGVINRHTQAERSVRYREQWRWDPEAKRWWLTSGMPDLWAGE